MKFSKFALACLMIAITAMSCKPDSVNPRNDADLGAFSVEGSTAGSTTDHTMPSPGCQVDVTGTLAIDMGGGTLYNLQGTGYVITNDETDLYVKITSLPGWGFGEVALDIMEPGVNPPVDVLSDLTDMTGFTAYEVVSPTVSWYTWKVPMNELRQNVSIAVAARLINSYNSAQNFIVWAGAKPVLDPVTAMADGGFTVDYQLGMTNCPTTCEPWLGATNNPCLSTPPCTIPSVQPGADLSEYACGNPNAGKVTVCHFPPGNPANMQEICISTSALPAHIIDFKPATDPCMGHHSGCHLGSCDPCGAGSSAAYAASIQSNCPGN